MAGKRSWRDPLAPSWERISPLRPFWEQNVSSFDSDRTKDSPFLGPRKQSISGRDPSRDGDQFKIEIDRKFER